MEEKSMKKIFIALSVLATLTLGIGSALAVPGVPDKVPGSDFVAPFLVSADRVDATINSGPTTAYNLSEVRGSTTDLHFYFFTTKSALVYSVWVPITHWGTIMQDIGLLIRDMDATNRAKLAVTFNGASYFAGYIYAENHIWIPNTAAPGTFTRVRGTTDNVIGSIYFLDLANGKSGASAIPMKEYYVPTSDLVLQGGGIAGTPAAWTATPAQIARWAITGYSRTLVSAVPVTGGLMPLATTNFDTVLVDTYNNYERWSPMALAAATELVEGNTLVSTQGLTAASTATVLRYNYPNEIGRAEV